MDSQRGPRAGGRTAALIEHVSPEQHCLESLLFVIKTVFYAIFIITRFTSKVSQYDTIQNTILRFSHYHDKLFSTGKGYRYLPANKTVLKYDFNLNYKSATARMG